MSEGKKIVEIYEEDIVDGKANVNCPCCGKEVEVSGLDEDLKGGITNND
jgi:hypothetical protein